MAMIEDFTVFFNTDEFGVDMVHTPAGGPAADPEPAIFDENGTVFTEMGVATLGPAVLAPATTWPAIAQGDALAIGATGYLVRSVVPQNDGALLLIELVRS